MGLEYAISELSQRQDKESWRLQLDQGFKNPAVGNTDSGRPTEDDRQNRRAGVQVSCQKVHCRGGQELAWKVQNKADTFRTGGRQGLNHCEKKGEENGKK